MDSSDLKIIVLAKALNKIRRNDASSKVIKLALESEEQGSTSLYTEVPPTEVPDDAFSDSETDSSSASESDEHNESSSNSSSSGRNTNRSLLRNVQRALIAAGFNLDRFGEDGKFGDETRGALEAFKRKAKEDGRYTGSIDGDYDEGLLSLIKEYKKDSSDLPDEAFALHIGDSQMTRAFGRSLRSLSDLPVRKRIRGATNAASWVGDEQLIEYLKQGPSKIFISLNGNNIDGTADLIRDIQENVKGNPPVVWSGAPPPIRRTESSFKYLNSDSGFVSSYNRRKRWNNKVKGMMPASWVFIDPYDHIKLKSPKTILGKYIASGYTCGKCDGIHLPQHVARGYASIVNGLA